jgi:Zn-dependent alcohol dehydrogenase
MTETKLLYTKGDGMFHEGTIDIPAVKDNQIQVKNIMTGVCRSDVDMMLGKFKTLPLNMQGHEGLAQVTQVGAHVRDVQVGDHVATRGEPAYADIYNCDFETYVKVPTADPKYIVEPVACGINVIKQFETAIAHKANYNSRLLLIGSGFLSYVVYTYLKVKNYHFDITVLGNHNKQFWGDKLTNNAEGVFDVIIDLNNRSEVFDKNMFNTEALLILAAEKTESIRTNFADLLWNAVTVGFPSPRNKKFIECMREAVELISAGKLDVSNFWTKGYSRSTEWNNAFADATNRKNGYARGYIDWRK